MSKPEVFESASAGSGPSAKATFLERERLLALINCIPDDIFFVDAEGQVVLVNDAVRTSLGLGETDDLRGQLCEAESRFEIFTKDGRRREESPFVRALGGETVHGEELVRHVATGELRHREYHVAPVLLGGQVAGAVSSVRDITEHRRVQQAVERSSRRLAEMLDSIQDDFYVLDRNWVFIYASRRFTSRIGKTPEDFVGRNIWEMFPKHLGTPFEVNLRAAMDEREVRRFELSGEYTATWYRMAVFPTPEGVTVLGTDITEKIRLEESLLALNESLERRVNERTEEITQLANHLRALASELTQAEQRERQKLGKLLHDHIQQLLVSVQLSLERLAGTLPDDDSRSSCDRISALVKEVIHTSRSLAAELSPPVLHEKGLLAAVDWLGRQMLERHGLTVEVTAEGSDEVLVPEYRAFLFEAIRELLFNVVKHSGVKRANVRIASLDGTLKISVQDDGAGFDPDWFEAGSRASSGLGLFSLRERLNHLGGRLLVESVPGGGAHLQIVAPFAVAPAIPTEQLPVRAQPSSGPLVKRGEGQRKTTILLADDHPIVRQSLALLLRQESDFEIVAEAGDGAEAVEMAHRFRPDVVVMDISMPRMSGIEATRRLRQELPDIAVVGLSMHEDPVMEQAIREAGARHYATKGGSSEILISAIRAESRRAAGTDAIRDSGSPGKDEPAK